MPRYYFHLTDGKQVLNNHTGIDLPGNAAARDDALALARDLEHRVVMPGWNWTGWFVSSGMRLQVWSAGTPGGRVAQYFRVVWRPKLRNCVTLASQCSWGRVIFL